MLRYALYSLQIDFYSDDRNDTENKRIMMRSIDYTAVKTRNFNMNPDCLRVYMCHDILPACIDSRFVNSNAVFLFSVCFRNGAAVRYTAYSVI